VCSHLGGAGGGATPLLSFLDRHDAAALSLTCVELREMVQDFSAFQRRSSPEWHWPLGRLQGRVATVATLRGADLGGGELGGPHALAVLPDGSLLVGEGSSVSCVPVTASSAAAAAADAHARFAMPTPPSATIHTGLLGVGGLALCPDGSFYVSLREEHVIKRVALDGSMSCVAGRMSVEGSTDGPAAEALLSSPRHLSLCSDGSLFIAEVGRVRCLSPQGTVRTVLSNYRTSFSEAPGSGYPVGWQPALTAGFC